jgi:predicted transglutaminase-like cysteine proteinase
MGQDLKYHRDGRLFSREGEWQSKGTVAASCEETNVTKKVNLLAKGRAGQIGGCRIVKSFASEARVFAF